MRLKRSHVNPRARALNRAYRRPMQTNEKSHDDDDTASGGPADPPDGPDTTDDDGTPVENPSG